MLSDLDQSVSLDPISYYVYKHLRCLVYSSELTEDSKILTEELAIHISALNIFRWVMRSGTNILNDYSTSILL